MSNGERASCGVQVNIKTVVVYLSYQNCAGSGRGEWGYVVVCAMLFCAILLYSLTITDGYVKMIEVLTSCVQSTAVQKRTTIVSVIEATLKGIIGMCLQLW